MTIHSMLAVMALTTFISVDGQIKEVPIESSAAVEYFSESDTDIGDDVFTVTETLGHTEDGSTNESTLSNSVSSGDIPTPEPILDNPQVVALLEESVELLAENSASVIGTINSSVLNLMDRMVNEYPSHYKYAGFRTSVDDSYSSILYIAKRAKVNGNTITFSDDCIAVSFSRQSANNYSSYIYYEVEKSPNASVNVGNHSIVYTNSIDGFPTLGTIEKKVK